MNIAIIVGSSRPNRVSHQVAEWVYANLNKSEINYELVDLAEWDLPMYNEPIPPKARRYEGEHTRAWSEKIDSKDGFIIVSPEYNHSIPAILKNALDYLYFEWNKKPIAFVSYGSVGGARAVEHLRGIVAELQMVSVAPTVHLTGYFGGEIPSSYVENLAAMEDELGWWATALKGPRHQIAKGVK